MGNVCPTTSDKYKNVLSLSGISQRRSGRYNRFSGNPGTLISAAKNKNYSLSRLSYYLFNCSQNLLTQCHEYIVNLPADIDPCDSIQIEETFHNKIQKSFSFQSIARHAKMIYQHNYDLHSDDKVYFSFHLLDEIIPDFETRDFQKSEPRQLTAYNSSFYPLNF